MGGVVVIVGGGATGSAVAVHLLSDPAFRGRVVVVEKDPTYRLAASALSAASIRQQYSQAVNVRMSLHGIAFLREVGERLAVGEDRPSLGLKECGYLYLAADEVGASALRENHATQRREGADTELLDPAGLGIRFPWLHLADVALGSYGRSGEGWFDGWGLLQAYRAKARALGADYVPDAVTALERRGDRIAAVILRDGGRIACDTVCNCAGANGGAVAAMAGVSIPVRAKRRTVFAFACRQSLPGAPLLIDGTGVWMRPDGSAPDGSPSFVAGWSPPAAADPDWRDDDPDTQSPDWALFEEVVWPALAHRVPALATLRLGRAWAGPYDMNLVDHNALLGPADGVENLVLCNGFSGHGLQHAAAAGRGLAEWIVHGRYLTLDLSSLSPSRLAAGRPLVEGNVI